MKKIVALFLSLIIMVLGASMSLAENVEFLPEIGLIEGSESSMPEGEAEELLSIEEAEAFFLEYWGFPMEEPQLEMGRPMPTDVGRNGNVVTSKHVFGVLGHRYSISADEDGMVAKAEYVEYFEHYPEWVLARPSADTWLTLSECDAIVRKILNDEGAQLVVMSDTLSIYGEGGLYISTTKLENYEVLQGRLCIKQCELEHLLLQLALRYSL